MTSYGMLILPSANRVYAEAAGSLMTAELELFSRSVLSHRLSSIDVSTIGGVRYVTWECDSLSAGDVAFLSNLSAAYALFAFDGEFLRPLELHPLDRYDDDLISIPKYSGKTNEQFTKLLLNATVLSSSFADDMLTRRMRVLDPLCGRGTTLSQAVMYGYDAAGVEINLKDFEAYSSFLSTWLKRKRVKHHLAVGPLRRDRQVIARKLDVTVGPDKESYKAGDTQHVEVLQADTAEADQYFRRGSFDVLVTDAPYGVQHGSRTSGNTRSRNPLELLADAGPVWAGLLRSGGALGLAWNTLVASREDAAEVLMDAGLEPLNEGPYLNFRHRVDQSILRDVLIARKP